MERQMRAEREKREKILLAEGEKNSQILIAEGRKESIILNAEADKQSKIKAAEAEAESILKIKKALVPNKMLLTFYLKTKADILPRYHFICRFMRPLCLIPQRISQ